ncbi:ammonium transporter, partial [Acinetobacter ursingii]
MEHLGFWVTIIIVVFVLGSIFGLRVSPREKSLGLMRYKARKMG